MNIYQSFSYIGIQLFLTNSTIISVIRKSVCLFTIYERIQKAKYVIIRRNLLKHYAKSTLSGDGRSSLTAVNYFSVKLSEGMNASSFKKLQKVNMWNILSYQSVWCVYVLLCVMEGVLIKIDLVLDFQVCPQSETREIDRVRDIFSFKSWLFWKYFTKRNFQQNRCRAG